MNLKWISWSKSQLKPGNGTAKAGMMHRLAMTCLMGLFPLGLAASPVADGSSRNAYASSIPIQSPVLDEHNLTIDPRDYDDYPDFERLQRVLEHAGFTVRLELPPRRGSYGVLELDSQTVWINPVVFELGIAQHTLVHEAVHAAQLCASDDELMPLALGLEPPNIVRPYFTRYRGIRQMIEAEAYAVQALENSTEYVIGLLEETCLSEE